MDGTDGTDGTDFDLGYWRASGIYIGSVGNIFSRVMESLTKTEGHQRRKILPNSTG